MKTTLLFVLLIFAVPVLAQESGLAELIGIPVPEGLIEAPDERLVFDKPEGRIIHAEFGGSITGQEVMTFYRETLVQLGWVLDSEGVENYRASFIREDEGLTISIAREEPLRVLLDLGPREETS
ncbi:MAG: hypothetical protein V3R64_01370 [Sphingomonadales bacterium]